MGRKLSYIVRPSRRQKWLVTKNKSDNRIPLQPLWNHYERVIKSCGAILLFAQGIFYVDLVSSNRQLFRYDLVWDKRLTTGFLNARKMPLRQHEQIAVFYKKTPTYNPQYTIGEPLHGKGNIKVGSPVKKNQNYGKLKITEDSRAGETLKYPTSILHYDKPHPCVAVHRTEKPIKLLEYLITTYSNEGDVVMDSCMGSGSTCVACVNTNRRYIGFEIDPIYYETAKKRIKQAELEVST